MILVVGELGWRVGSGGGGEEGESKSNTKKKKKILRVAPSKWRVTPFSLAPSSINEECF